jgi:hypothetical protein
MERPTDTQILDWLDGFDSVEIKVTPDASVMSDRVLFAGALLGPCGSALKMRDVIAEAMNVR